MTRRDDLRLTCQNCEQEWVGRPIRLFAKDNDSLRCACGEILLDWNSTDSWHFTMARPGNTSILAGEVAE